MRLLAEIFYAQESLRVFTQLVGDFAVDDELKMVTFMYCLIFIS